MNLPELEIKLEFVLPEADKIVNTEEHTVLPVLEPEKLDFGFNVVNDEISAEQLQDDRDPYDYFKKDDKKIEMNQDYNQVTNQVLFEPH